MAPSSARIDVHHHVLPPGYMGALSLRGIDLVAGRRLPEWNRDTALAAMDANAIQAAITSLSAPGVWLGEDTEACRLAREANEFCAELVKDRPDRFGAFASLPLPDVDGALNEIAHAADVLNVDGFILLTNVAGHQLGDSTFEPVYAELNRRNAVVLVHPTAPMAKPRLPIADFTLEFVFETTRALVNLAYQGVLQRNPDIRFIASHAGGTAPYLPARIQRGWSKLEQAVKASPEGPLVGLKRIYYDTALSSVSSTLDCVLAFAGEDRVLFGTDYPFADAVAVNEQVDAVDAHLATLPETTQSAVLCGNALRLFPRLASGAEGRPGRSPDDTSRSTHGQDAWPRTPQPRGHGPSRHTA